MLKFLLGAGLSLALATTAAAGPMWELYNVTVKSSDAAKVVAATDKFMNTDEGEAFGGRLLLIESLANGANPTTHAFVVLNDSAASAEAWAADAMSSRAWSDYMKAVEPISTPVSEARFAVLDSWGATDTDAMVWIGHMISTDDPGAVVAALTKWRSSSKGSQFPGQGFLSAPIAMGQTDVTHMVHLGYASEAEMEAWSDSLAGNADWRTFLEEINAAADYHGAEMSRTVKVWGASSSDLVN